MKLLLLLLLLSFTSFAQTKGDNAIIITTPDSSSQAYVKLVVLLQDNGYAIEKADEKLLTIQTDNSPLNNSGIRMYITAYIRGSAVHLQGKYSYDINTIAEVKGAGVASYKSGIDKVCFLKLDELAKKYPEGKVSYSKK